MDDTKNSVKNSSDKRDEIVAREYFDRFAPEAKDVRIYYRINEVMEGNLLFFGYSEPNRSYEQHVLALVRDDTAQLFWQWEQLIQNLQEYKIPHTRKYSETNFVLAMISYSVVVVALTSELLHLWNLAPISDVLRTALIAVLGYWLGRDRFGKAG